MGIVSSIELVFAEAPLAGVDWSSSSTAYASGAHGRVLGIALSQSAEGFRSSLDKGPPYRFRLDEGYSVSVAVPEHGDGEWRRLELSIPAADITADDDWLRGELSWSGSITLTDDGTDHTLTGVTATFSLPLEDVQPRWGVEPAHRRRTFRNCDTLRTVRVASAFRNAHERSAC